MIASSNELIYFVELAHTLNFSRAAERIGISQPTLSAAIKRLESSIGAALFIRNKNGVIPTPAGKRLLSHAKQLIQLWQTAKSESLASHHEIQGCVSLGCHASVAIHSLHKFLPQLISSHPKLEINLQHDLSRKIVEGVINFSIDIGIIVNPVKHPDLIIQKLYEDRVTLWHTTEANNTVIICDPDLVQTAALLKKLPEHGVTLNRMITSSNLEVIASLTAHGAGIGILPTSVALSAYPLILKTLPAMPAYQDEICLAYRHENRHIKAIEALVRAIKSYCRELSLR